MKYIFILVLLSSLTVYCQDRETVHGKIVSRSKNLEGIHVSNVSSGKFATTAKGGYFDIPAKEKDTLMFSSPLFFGYNMVLDSISLKQELIFVPLEESALSTQLDEINITNISAESLGLVSKDMKKRTPGERRLYSATSGGGIIPINMIISAITGKTAMLKKALVYEKQEIRKDKLLKFFNEEYIKNDYMIPDDYVMDFVYKSVLDTEVIIILDSPDVNKMELQLRLGVLAMDFMSKLKEKENGQQK